MLIFEVADPNTAKLLGLANFLQARAKDTNSPQEISLSAFLNYAHNMDIDVDPTSLANMASTAPLSTVLQPIEPGSDIIRFKGSPDEATSMPVDKAQDIVAASAKNAMKRGMK